MNSSSKLNILHICSWYPNRLDEFDGNFVFRHIRTLVNHTNSKILAVYEDENLTDKKVEFVEVEEDGVKGLIIYHKSYKLKFINKILKFYYYYKGYRLLKKQFGEIDIIHSHLFIYAGVFSWLLSLFIRTPYIITEHSSFFNQKTIAFPVLAIFKFVAKRSAFILPVSDHLGQRIRSFGIKGRFLIIPNVVNTSIFNLGDSKRSKEKINFVHISNFVPVKNIPGILNAIKKLSGFRNDFLFTIAGDGNLSEVKKIVEKLDIDLNILKFKGKMSEVEVARLLKENDVFVLFSNSENLPCVLLEAQACGMPIISSDVGGIPEIIQNKEYGILLKPKDEEALVKAMSEMIDNFNKYNRERIAHLAHVNYGEESVRKAIMAIYKNGLQ